MPSCLLFRNDAPVMDLKMKLDSPFFYVANVSTGKKDAYEVHEYVKVDHETNETFLYQIAYDKKPSNEEVEKALFDLKAEPISQR